MFFCVKNPPPDTITFRYRGVIMTKEELKQYLAALYAIKKTGAKRVTHNGKTVEFHSLAEIAAEREQTEAKLDRMSGRRIRTVMVERLV